MAATLDPRFISACEAAARAEHALPGKHVTIGTVLNDIFGADEITKPYRLKYARTFGLAQLSGTYPYIRTARALAQLPQAERDDIMLAYVTWTDLVTKWYKGLSPDAPKCASHIMNAGKETLSILTQLGSDEPLELLKRLVRSDNPTLVKSLYNLDKKYNS